MFATNSSTLSSRRSFWIALTLALVACLPIVLLRLYPTKWHLASIGALALFAGARLRSWPWLLLPLALTVATDYLLSLARPGNPFPNEEMVFVYGTYTLVFVLGHFLGNTENPVRLGSLSLGGAVLFFLVTNFGAWLNVAILHTVVPAPGYTDYSPDLAGLMLCYERGLPFFRGTLEGDLTFAVLLFGAHALALRVVPQPAAERQEAVS